MRGPYHHCSDYAPVSDFHQAPPTLGNTYTGDAPLRRLLERLLPADTLHELEGELADLGNRAAGEILALGDAAEADPPRHVPFDAWGRRVDRIETSAAWRTLERLAAREGLVARAYERRRGALSRIDQFARVYLFHPSSATVTCPFAMADGAAGCLELHGGGDERLRSMKDRLTSNDPDRFWTSGQWMTERTGGSDVSGTATVARCVDGEWRLHGDKWFTSAINAPMTLALARADGAAGAAETAGAAAPRELTLFALQTRDSSGAWQHIRVNRLKDKLGTRALPTAEVTLEGTPAILVGEPGHGVRTIAPVLTITRVWNTFCAASLMRRAVTLASDYARRRVASGRRLIDQPLHVETLAMLEVETRAALQLVFHAALLLGREENGEASEDERALLRLLVPIAKLLTAKQAVAVASEALEAIGGAGYMEDTGLPRLLRDAQVLPIWEGTTSVLSLDVLRALQRTDALGALLRYGESALARLTSETLRAAAAPLRERLALIAGRVHKLGRDEQADAAGARALALSIGHAHTAALLAEQAQWDERSGRGIASAEALRRWCAAPAAAALGIDHHRERRMSSRTLVESEDERFVDHAASRAPDGSPSGR
ncbi:MAG: acyl-CoA dehydrogenase family protein [Gemmatimonadaceae bacterium]